MDIHVGKLVLNLLKERGMKKSEFGRRINRSRQNVQDIFRRQSLDTELLSEISKALNYNFFQLLSDKQTAPSSGHVMEEQTGYRKNAKADKQKYQSQIENLNKQLKLAQKEITYLKKINGLLEKKKGARKPK
ncbi:MAG: helix-turn-helix domain-containing protein [Cytophagaceae bacterium]|nr:helix-turn-helix domain-containing protein [Cytophagaceae bacterium]